MFMIGARYGQEKQLKLFETEEDQHFFPANNGGSGFSDPAFASNKTLPVHRWVPWIAGFSSDFVKGVLNRYLQGKGTVLDPFAGVGTTLVEAALLGHRAIGFEINPYAAFACRIKLIAYRVTPETLLCEMVRFRAFYNEKLSSDYTPKSILPKGFKTRAEFYSSQVLRKVLILDDFMDTLKSEDLRNLFKLAFASTMIRYSNYSYEPSLGRRVSSGKEAIQDFPVGEMLLSKLREMVDDIVWLRSCMGAEQINAEVIN